MDEKPFDPWISLAAEICNRGIKENDTAFLNSEWYDTLKSTVFEWNNMQDARRSTGEIRRTARSVYDKDR